MRAAMILMIAAAWLILACGCVNAQRPRSDRDPYVIDSSSDPRIGVGNPY